MMIPYNYNKPLMRHILASLDSVGSVAIRIQKEAENKLPLAMKLNLNSYANFYINPMIFFSFLTLDGEIVHPHTNLLIRIFFFTSPINFFV